MSELEDRLQRVRAQLQEQHVKLWQEPYYEEGVGSIDTAMELLSMEFSNELHISVSDCKMALLELQENALQKLAARREYDETGLATFHVRCVDSTGGMAKRFEVKCALVETGSNLQQKVAQELNVEEAQHVKCISAGRILTQQESLQAQGLKNNQQLLVILGQVDAKGEALHERLRQLQADVETLVDSGLGFLELEDQNGTVIHLPPSEHRSLLMGMSYYEKGRAVMRKEHYDEALLIFLEADEKFSNCNSKYLETVDNYALLHLDIVWCYLCLKNLNQLPDAQRRLDLCERIFQRSYGENYTRLYALKGNNCPERALIMRLQLLQGVLLYHQNRRDEALHRLNLANDTLTGLKIDPEQLMHLVEMGFETADARIALRSANGHLDRAIDMIQERRQRLQTARNDTATEREMHRQLVRLPTVSSEPEWIHPRSVCRLMELGYERSLVVEALRRSKNDLQRSLDLLQSSADELRQHLPSPMTADDQMLHTLTELGFHVTSARAALETTRNNMIAAVDFLLKSLTNEQELLQLMKNMSKFVVPRNNEAASSSGSGQSNNSLPVTPSKLELIQEVLDKAQLELASYGAYERFHEDLPENEQDYLDLTLEKDEEILLEYKRLLED